MITTTQPHFAPNCPLPVFDFDIITLGHGSGGALTNQLLDSGVFSLLSNPYLDPRHDGAFLEMHGPTAFTTDSFVISPIFFPGGNIGELAMHGTINDLAMCGAIPKYLSLGFILEEGLPMEDLWKIIHSIKEVSEKLNIPVVTGDTKVVERGKGDKIFINTTGLGQVHRSAAIDSRNIKTGDAIIVSGSLANHGIAIMSKREGLEFETEVLSDTRALSPLTLPLLDQFGRDIHLFRDPTRGGVATVLNEIAGMIKRGINLDEMALPVVPQVEGACEMLGLDPLYVANEGIFVAFVDKSVADEFISALHQLPEGEEAAMIGEVVAEHPGQVVMQSKIGGRRIVQMLPGDQLPRIC